MDLREKIRLAIQKGLPGADAHRLLTPYRPENNIPIPKNARESAVMCMVFEEAADWKIVLIKRPEYEGHHSAQVSFPGGKRETNDPTLLHTALRETNEEIGLLLEENEIAGELSSLYIPPSNFLVNPFIALLEKRPVYSPNPREVAYVFESTLNELLLPDRIKTGKVRLSSGISINTPYFDLNNEIVWGATAAILSEIREIIK